MSEKAGSRRLAQTFFHGIAAGFYVYVMALDRLNEAEKVAVGIKIPGLYTYAGRYKYLTQINLVLQLIFFLTAIVSDVGSIFSVKWCRRSQKISDFIFTVMAFPCAMFVVVSFWSIYAINRELIYPQQLDAIVPPMINLYQHLFIGVFVLIESAMTRHNYPTTKSALTAIFGFSLTYFFWLLWVYHFGGFWAYGFLTVLSPAARAVFVFAMFLFIGALYFLGKWLNSRIWSGKDVTKVL